MDVLLEPRMVVPLLACLVITAIHVYFGIHVLARGVIFVDIALAQIAAVGTAFAVYMGYHLQNDAFTVFLYALSFTLVAALVFSLTREREGRVPHEAIIGIIYAVSMALTILLLSESALGPEELEHMLTRDLIWVKKEEVLKSAIVYAFVGIFHALFAKRFILISSNPDAAKASGWNIGLWDFLFYATFGLVITHSFNLVGVLMVFTYLVIPSVIASLFAKSIRARLILGWLIGAVVSYIGLRLAYHVNKPVGPFIVSLFGGVLIFSGVVYYLLTASNKVRGFRNVFLYGCAFALFFGVLYYFRKPTLDEFHEALKKIESPSAAERKSALQTLGRMSAHKAEIVPHLLQHLDDKDAQIRATTVKTLENLHISEALLQVCAHLTDPSDEVREAAIKFARVIGSTSAVEPLLSAAKQEQDPSLAIEMAEALLELGEKRAIPMFVAWIENTDTPDVPRQDAFEHLRTHVPVTFTISEIAKVKAWYAQNEAKLVWDAKTRRFEVKE